MSKTKSTKGRVWNNKTARNTAGPLNVLKLPLDRGYGVKTPNVTPEKRNNWNVALTLPYGDSMYLWVDDFSTDFQMGGTTAQSRFMRQFFPHNFMQPAIKISGIMPNQHQYNKLAAFVRQSHYDALTVNQIANAQDFVTQNGGRKVTPEYRTGPNGALPTVKLQLKAGGVPVKRNQKGRHRAWVLEGYIKAIAAGSARFENAPRFTFDFIPAQSQFNASTGIYEDTLVRGSQITDWMTLFNDKGFSQVDGPNKVKDTTKDAAKILGTIFGIIGL